MDSEEKKILHLGLPPILPKMELLFRNFDKQEDEEKMDATLPQPKPQNPNHVPRKGYVSTPVGRDNENARRTAKRNLSEEIRIAQRDVDNRERRIAPLRQGLKNARSRLARLQKVKAAETGK